MDRTSTRGNWGRKAGLLALLTLWIAASIAAEAGGPSPNAEGNPGGIAGNIPRPEPFLAELGARTSPIPYADLVTAALLASGVPETELPSRRAALEALLSPILASARAVVEGGTRAEALLELLHKRGVFRAYSVPATTLVDVMDKGYFNCVSSAVVYLIAARALGIECEGVSTVDHAFCRVLIGDRWIDVETTTPYGFDPGVKRDFTDSFGRVTGYSYVPPGAYASRKDIDARRLISLILSNRAELLEGAGRWEEALALAVSYEALVPGAEGRDFALGRINNLAASLMNRGQWSEARDLASEARARWGEDPRIDKISATAADGLLVKALGTRPFAESLGLVEDSLARGDITIQRAREFYVYLYGNEANRIGRSGDWLGAAALAEEGSSKSGGSPVLAQAARNFRHNFVASVHNRFVALYNARRFSEAAAAVEEGLAKLPDDPTLKSDLAAAQAAIRR